jgi:hypothetical protein
MSRSKTKKKSASRSATKAKKTVAKNTMSAKPVNTSDLQQLEKYVMQAPGALAGQLAKQISAAKKQEKALKAALATAKNKSIAAAKTMQLAKKNSKTAAGKKQLNAAKTAYALTQKNHDGLAKELQAVSNSVLTLATQAAKMTELSKHLKQFTTIWSKKLKEKAAKEAQALKAKKAKTAAKKRQAKEKQAAAKSVAASTPAYDHARDRFEKTPDNTFNDETLEIGEFEETTETESNSR